MTTTQPRYTVRLDGPNRYGVEFFSIVDGLSGEVRATWTVGHYAASQCAWLNAHQSDAPPFDLPESVKAAMQKAREAGPLSVEAAEDVHPTRIA